MAYHMKLRPRKEKPERLLALFWYTLPGDLLWYIGQVAARDVGPPRYALRSRAKFLGADSKDECQDETCSPQQSA